MVSDLASSSALSVTTPSAFDSLRASFKRGRDFERERLLEEPRVRGRERDFDLERDFEGECLRTERIKLPLLGDCDRPECLSSECLLLAGECFRVRERDGDLLDRLVLCDF